MGKITGDKKSIGLYYDSIDYEFRLLGDHLSISTLKIIMELSKKGLLKEVDLKSTPSQIEEFLATYIDDYKDELNEILNQNEKFIIFSRVVLDCARAEKGWHASNRKYHPDLYDDDGYYYSSPLYSKEDTERRKEKKRIDNLKKQMQEIENITIDADEQTTIKDLYEGQYDYFEPALSDEEKSFYEKYKELRDEIESNV